MRGLCAAVLAGMALVGCATVARNDPGRARPGADTVVAAGERQGPFGRTYRLFVPSAVKEDDVLRPLVIALHGGVATARIFAEQTGFSAVGEENDFFVLYPNGIGVFSAFRHWNAGWCCATAAKNGVDDVGFVGRVLEQVASVWPIDRERVYVVGYSNGGMLAHRVALQWGAERVAGLAVFAGPVGPLGTPAPSTRPPIPTLMIHGTADERLSVDGSLPDRRGNELLGAKGSAQFWATRNGCRAELVRAAEGEADPVDRAPGEEEREDSAEPPSWTRTTWCAGTDAEVWLDLLKDWGHDWPGPKFTAARRSKGLAGYDAATEIARFFGLGSRPNTPDG